MKKLRMKKLHFPKVLILVSLLGLMLSCKKSFYQIPPTAQLLTSQVEQLTSLNDLLTAAYASLEAYGTNWKFGDCASDDAYFGGDYSFQFEKHTVFPTNGDLDDKWSYLYNGVYRTNVVLKTLAATPGLDSATTRSLRGQALFLRAFYYFQLRVIFKNVPYVTERSPNLKLTNTVEIWPFVESDLTKAIAALPATEAEKGRVNSWAAKALLAKAYLFQSKFALARTLLTDIIQNGMTSDGQKYALVANFRNAFDVKTKNSSESVFAVQHAVSVASNGANAATGETGNHPVIPGVLPGGVTRKPSINLANAFKTDANGLPLFDHFNDMDLRNENGADPNAPFLNDSTTALDPRIDWTIGRRGILYLDYGIAPSVSIWAAGYNNSFGPYWPVKNVLYKADLPSYAQALAVQDAHNYNVIRFADVLLWAAECEVETGSLGQALVYVNQIRSRAKTSTYIKQINPITGMTLPKNAANYQIGLYASFPNQAYARDAVRFERRLELAMEGHRFFDLVRWGTADQVIKAYLVSESRPGGTPGLAGGMFVKGKNEYFPIPQVEITNSYLNGAPTLIQNPYY